MIEPWHYRPYRSRRPATFAVHSFAQTAPHITESLLKQLFGCVKKRRNHHHRKCVIISISICNHSIFRYNNLTYECVRMFPELRFMNHDRYLKHEKQTASLSCTMKAMAHGHG